MNTAPILRCGLEFEYLLRDLSSGQIRDFSNLDFHTLSELLADKPGQQDPLMAVGDMGIRRGYWYLEGDERFHPDGRFRTLAVKGVEIRTPPACSIEQAVQSLLEIEGQLTQLLARSGLGLSIAALNPQQAAYVFDPPLNPFEQQLRAEDHEYDGMEVSTLTFGPDINLSFEGWSDERNLDIVRKLNYYAPFMVPFSFSSPFVQGSAWGGYSRRTWVRSACRPIVKTFVSPECLERIPNPSPLLRPARIPSEQGRIEFKAFDAMSSVALLRACCALVKGLCLDDSLTERSEITDVPLFLRAATDAFNDAQIHQGAGQVLQAAMSALGRVEDDEGLLALECLRPLWMTQKTPAHEMLAACQLYQPQGLLGSKNSEVFSTQGVMPEAASVAKAWPSAIS